jgi:hypothetical protein
MRLLHSGEVAVVEVAVLAVASAAGLVLPSTDLRR